MLRSFENNACPTLHFSDIHIYRGKLDIFFFQFFCHLLTTFSLFEYVCEQCTVLLPVVRRAGYGIAAQGEAGQLGTQVEKAHRIKARHSVAEKNRPQMLTI